MPIVHGLPACTCLSAWIPVFESELARYGIKVRFTQLNGSYGPSAGTHKAGAFDLVVTVTGDRSLSAAYDIVVKIARQMGADATWERPYNWDRRGGIRHTHGVLTKCPHLSWQARAQQTAVKAGRNGLANLGRDTGPRPLSGRTYIQGIAWAKARQTPVTIIRAALYNLPDEGTKTDPKLPNAPARIAAGVPLVQKKGAPTFIAWNELVGIKGPNNASDHARAVDGALSSTWLLVKPTLPLNENYISYRSDLLEVVRQYEDKVLPSEHGGRHLTRVVFRYKKTGLVFAVGVSHLVNGADADASRQRQAKDGHRYLENVSQLHDDCPYIYLADANMHHDLRAMVDAGMKRASRWADEHHGEARAATYTKYAYDKPSTNPEKAIDQIYFSKHWYVNEWDVIRDLTSTGNYVDPRPSDHDPVVAEAKTS